MPTSADGKLRTGVITGDTERYVATELRRQGLTPVYIGAQAQKSAWSLELPDLANRKGLLTQPHRASYLACMDA